MGKREKEGSKASLLKATKQDIARNNRLYMLSIRYISYLDDIALNRDFKESENDCNSEGPALS